MTSLLNKIIGSGVANLSIRAATLFFRFALSFYIISYLGLEAAGIYGLAVGAIGIVPAAVGWGLNYFVAREVVGLSPDAATPLVKNRLIVTFLSLLAATAVVAPFLAFAPEGSRHIYMLILLLIWLETFALDIYMPLIGLELALQANLLVLVRSAAWIPVVVLLGLISPAFRTLDTIFLAWIASHIVANGLLWLFLRPWPVARALSSAPFEGRWVARRIKSSWYIYLSDLGLVGLVYADRYIVSYLLGLAQTGIYSFYWSITNALQTLMMTAVVQLALPRMIKAYRDGTLADWQGELRRQMMKTLAFAVILSGGIFIATECIIRLSPPGRFPVFRSLLALLLLAAIIRSCSDLLNVGITSTGRDKYYALTNIFGVILTICFSFLFLSLFGLIGSGLSSLATAVLLLLARFFYLRRLMGAGAVQAAPA